MTEPNGAWHQVLGYAATLVLLCLAKFGRSNARARTHAHTHTHTHTRELNKQKHLKGLTPRVFTNKAHG